LEKNSKRLESIKAAHTIKKVASTTREEDYLEVIAELVELKGYATTLDISRFMNVSPPSVTKMLQKLDEKKYLKVLAQGASMRFLLTRVFDYLNLSKGALLTIKDPVEYLKRLEFHNSVKSFEDYCI